MKSRNLFVGVLVLFTGIVALLSVLGVFEFHWTIMWRLWPVFLIIIGIALLPFKEYVRTLMLLAALALGSWLYYAEYQHYEGNVVTRFFNNHFSSWNWDWDNDDDDEGENYDNSQDDYPVDQHFSEPFAEVEKASIDIDFGAGELELKHPCAELATVDATSNFVKYSFRTEPREGETAIFLSGKGHTKGTGRSTENDIEIALCAHPVWNFSLDMGAASADLDFTPYKVENIKVNGGACDLDMRLGNNGCNVNVEISTGASDIDIEVPMGVDCEVRLDSAITGKEFNGFEKVEKGLWRTPGFGQGANQIIINMNCAVSDITVTRY